MIPYHIVMVQFTPPHPPHPNHSPLSNVELFDNSIYATYTDH